jgi:hypothetical protein
MGELPRRGSLVLRLGAVVRSGAVGCRGAWPGRVVFHVKPSVEHEPASSTSLVVEHEDLPIRRGCPML